jgi:uncharacterized protein YkwD
LRSRRPLALFALASLLLAACGVPISAADLTLTPEISPTPDNILVAVSSRSIDGDPAVRPLAAAASSSPLASLTARPSASPASTGTPGPTSTPSITPTPTVTPTATPFGTPAPTATPAPAGGSLTDQALAILNKYRTDSGRPPLRVNAALAAAANAYAKTMADNNWFYCGCDFHTGPDGSQPDQRVYRAGYTGQWKGEAIAGGQDSAQSVINTWLNSPAHAAIVLDPSAVEVGIGYYYKAGDLYAHYWVLTTGVP